MFARRSEVGYGLFQGEPQPLNTKEMIAAVHNDNGNLNMAPQSTRNDRPV
jgi:hypothetical protein